MTTETVDMSSPSEPGYDKLLTEVVEFLNEKRGDEDPEVTVKDVVDSLNAAGGNARITRDTDGYITDVQYGAEGGRRRSRLNKKTRRSKGRRRHTIRRKLRKLTSRRR
jgi:hypothetical protein